jgi:DNA-binding NarL/FixJ family response regulator
VEAPRVLIICEPGLFAQGMRTLLATNERVEIIGITDDACRAAELIREAQPTVIMLEADQFSLKLGHAPQTLALDWTPLLIAFCRNDNVLQICRIEERDLTSPNDLIETLSL